MAYTYRVIKAFKRVGDGERQFSVGDKLTLDRPAKSLTHLELLPDDDAATEPVQAADKPIGTENVTLKATDLDRPKRGRPRKDQA
jgi:hypothetical protein